MASDEESAEGMRQIDVEILDHDIVETVIGGCEFRYPTGTECDGDGWHELTVSYGGDSTTLLLCELHAKHNKTLERQR